LIGSLIVVGISDPALVAGGDAIILYFGIVAAIGASVFGWLYVNHKRKAKKGIGSPAAPNK